MVPGVKSYFTQKYSAYPKEVLWSPNQDLPRRGTVYIYWRYNTLYFGEQNFPSLDMKWDDLQPYFFWRYTRVDDDSTFYISCTQGEPDSVVAERFINSKIIHYSFDFDLWDLPAPQDSSVWVYNLVVSDTPNSVGNIVATCGKDSSSVLHSTVDTHYDTLQLTKTDRRYHTSAYLKPMLKYFPNSVSILSPLFFYYFGADSCMQVREIGSRIIRVKENHLDPVPTQPMNVGMRITDYRRMMRKCSEE